MFSVCSACLCVCVCCEKERYYFLVFLVKWVITDRPCILQMVTNSVLKMVPIRRTTVMIILAKDK